MYEALLGGLGTHTAAENKMQAKFVNSDGGAGSEGIQSSSSETVSAIQRLRSHTAIDGQEDR